MSSSRDAMCVSATIAAIDVARVIGGGELLTTRFSLTFGLSFCTPHLWW